MKAYPWPALLLVLFIAACGEREPDLQPLGTDDVILAFGDSLTYGSGASPEHAYPAVLQKLSGHRVVNAGVPGEVSEEGLRRLPQLLEKHHPALVILTHGGNDLLRKLPPEGIRQNLVSMIELIRQHQAQVVLVAVPRPSVLLSPDPLYEAVAESQRVPLEKNSLSTILRSHKTKSDTIHPNEKGYAMLAEAVYLLLKDRQAL